MMIRQPRTSSHLPLNAGATDIRIDRKFRSTDVIDVLSDLFILQGVPDHISPENGPDSIAKAVRGLMAAVGSKTA